MALIELSKLIGAIGSAAAPAAKSGLERNGLVIKLLKQFKLDPKHPPADFPGVYAYTLVEYGVGKPKPLLEMFRQEEIQQNFRQAFEQDDPSIILKEGEDFIYEYALGDEIRELLGTDYRKKIQREFATFTAVFNEVVNRTRTPAEVRRDQKIIDIHSGIGELIEKLNKLDIDKMSEELARLVSSYQARQFVLVPTGNKLKVFISSKMMELLDVRQFIAEKLSERGIEAWVYEANAGAKPESIVETSLREVEAADIYVGLFWKQYGEVTAQEYLHARTLGKPCFVYIRDQNAKREDNLDSLLKAEIKDPQRGVTYNYFDSSEELSKQVADDIMTWLIQQHRQMTAEICEARVSKDEIARLEAEVKRLQAASRERLPQGSAVDYLAQQMRAWFKALGYVFESYTVRAEEHFEWIVNVPNWRGNERILVRGIEGEAEISDLTSLRQAIDHQMTDGGWLVAARRISQAARNEAAKRENRDLSCYTFDELLDQTADFSRYFDWLEAEVKRRGIDQMYVPLACTKEEFDPGTKEKIGQSHYDSSNGWSEGYITRWLADPAKEHISILGEFGTGKTWFTLHYAWTALQRYREAKEQGIKRPRLPLVIPLRDYAKAVSVESLFSELFFRKLEIRQFSYSAFEQLNRMGKLLLIFDGFDEMADKVDRQKMINNFWELARMVVPGSKALLTCRTEHFPEAKEGRALLNAELQASTAALTGEAPQFEVLQLEKFDDSQIRQLLAFQATPETVEQVMSNSELLDLARRPVMIELILEALPEIEAGKPVDMSRIYLYAVQRKLERDIKAKRTFTSLADKLYFLCEVSWEMLSTDQMSLNYRLFPDRLRRLFSHAVQTQKDLDHWHYDMMGQTILIPNAEGDYKPAHRSLLEFFVAYKFAAELGVLAPDFTEAAKSQSFLGGSIASQDYTWSSYFQREVDETGDIKPIAPLQEFSLERMDKLVETVGQESLTKAILDLIKNMLISNKEEIRIRLLPIIEETRGKTIEEVGILGGNVATLLILCDPLAFVGRDLSNTNLQTAQFYQSTLTECNLQGANLKSAQFYQSTLTECVLQGANLVFAQFYQSTLTECNLQGADLEFAQFYQPTLTECNLQGANLEATQFYEPDIIACNLRTTNLRNAHLSNVVLANSDLQGADLTHIYLKEDMKGHCVAFSPDGMMLAIGNENTRVQVLDVVTGKNLFTLKAYSKALQDVCWSPNGLWIATSHDSGDTYRSGDILLWDVQARQTKAKINSDERQAFQINFSQNSNLLATTGLSGKVKIWKIVAKQLVELRQFDSNNKPSLTAVFCFNDENLICSGSDGVIQVWDIAKNELVIAQKIVKSVHSLCLSPDEKKVALGAYKEGLYLLNSQTLEAIWHTAYKDFIYRPKFSSDGRLLFACSREDGIVVVVVETGLKLDSLGY